MSPLYVDISAWQGTIDFHAYCKWAKQWDGVARIAMKATEGVGYIDPRFESYRAGALAAGIDCAIYYHFARADLGNSAQAEADWLHRIVGSIRPRDMIMLDFELTKPQCTAQWALAWLARQEQNYGGKLPTIYSYDAYVRGRLQDARLARFPLILANWQFHPQERPPCPPPWKEYMAVQYTDKAMNIPGIPGPVDANVYCHHGK